MYKPLPDGLTIKESQVQGLGLFATRDVDADVVDLIKCGRFNN